MTRKCPRCGETLEEGARFCGKCGEKLIGVNQNRTSSDTMFQDEYGKYTWVYELPMAKSLFILVEVWKVLGMAAVIILVFSLLIGLFTGDFIDTMISMTGGLAIAMAIIMVLSLPAYWIVTYANNGKYTVLFEMDEEGIDHTQIKTEKAKALEQLTMAFGRSANSFSTMGAGMLSSSSGSLYSNFSRVKRIKACPDKNLIRVNGRFVHNQVYAEGKDFDFVYKYIVNHCPQARID